MGSALTVLGRFLLVLAIICSSTACTTWNNLHRESSPIPYDVEVGDKVKLATYDGQQHEFKVIDVTEDSIQGKGLEIPWEEVKWLERRGLDKKGIGVTTATIVAALVAMAVGLSQ
ncbi:MAG: hypothetical protein V7754_08875 [Halioglobus sp.]